MASTPATTSKTSSSRPRPVILITGANAGLGFATCQRLLLQLSSPCPTDTLGRSTRFNRGDGSDDEEPLVTPFAAPHGCTIIMACRNAIKAQKARASLVKMIEKLKSLPDDVETPMDAGALERLNVTKPVSARGTLAKREPEDAGTSTALDSSQQAQRRSTTSSSSGSSSPTLSSDLPDREARARAKYRRRFCRGTRIDIIPLDLGSFGSVLNCASQVSSRYGHLTHIILNAGGAAFMGLDWIRATWMIMTSFRAAVTYPRYKMQRSGDLSQDGVGWVWSINVGGSWALTQALLPLMRQSPYAEKSRIIWTGSIEAFRRFFSLDDMQCLRTDVPSKAYESTKYQCDLAAVAMREELAESGEGKQAGSEEKQPSVYLTHPGVVATSIMADFLNVFTGTAMLWAFYFARWLLSPHHCVEPYKGAISASFACLAPEPRLALSASLPDGRTVAKPDAVAPARTPAPTMVRYGSRCDFWGREYVDFGRIDAWQEKTDEAGIVVDEGGDEGSCNVRGLARRWRERTQEVVEQIKRDKEKGKLPPFAAKHDEEVARNDDVEDEEDDEDEDEDSSDEWEKVDKAV